MQPLPRWPHSADLLQRLGARHWPTRLPLELRRWPTRPSSRVGAWGVWALALALALLWHAGLDAQFYRYFPAAIWLEGPLPAVLGAGVGLWLHRARDRQATVPAGTVPAAPSPGWFLGLAACGFAALGLLLAILLPGPFAVGLLGTLKGLWGLLRAVWPASFFVLPEVWGTPYASYVGWMCVKALLLWGAAGYVAALLVRAGRRDWLRWRWRDLTQSRAFRRDQKQRLREYRQAYLAALSDGQPPPPRPVELVPDVAMGDGWGNHARTAFWLVRIVLLLVGGVSFWAMFGDALVHATTRAISPALPWWIGLLGR